MKGWKIVYRFCVIVMLWAIVLNVMPKREFATRSFIEFVLVSMIFIFGVLASLFSELEFLEEVNDE